MANHFWASDFIGGAAGALDEIDGNDLSQGDAADVVLAGGVWPYVLNATSGEAESFPYIIAPDVNPGTKRWELVNFPASVTSGYSAPLSAILDRIHDIYIRDDEAKIYKKNRIVTDFSFTTKSIILDCANTWGPSTWGMGIRSMEFKLNDVLIPVAPEDITCYGAEHSPSYSKKNLFDTSTSKTGGEPGNTWVEDNSSPQRITCVFDTPIVFDEVVVNNYHNAGLPGDYDDWGVKNIKISSSTDAITSTIYNGDISNSDLVFDGQLAQHTEVDQIEDQILDIEHPTTSDQGWDLLLDTKAVYADITLYVATTGDDDTLDGTNASTPFASVQGALNWLDSMVINSDVTVTIQCADGAYTGLAAIENTHPNSDKIVIKGENVHTRAFTSVVSMTGSSGSYTLVLAASDTSDVSVGDFVVIKSASGGTNPGLIPGCWEVTAVSASTSISLKTTHQYGGTLASGAVAGDMLVCKTLLQFATGEYGSVIDPTKVLHLRDLVLEGYANTESTDGLRVLGTLITTDYTVGLSNFGIGVLAIDGGVALAKEIAVSNCDTGINSESGGVIQAEYGAIAGNIAVGVLAVFAKIMVPHSYITGNGGDGLRAFSGADVTAYESLISFNTGDGVYTWASYVAVDDCEISNHTAYGIDARYSAVVRSLQVTFSNNASGNTIAASNAVIHTA